MLNRLLDIDRQACGLPAICRIYGRKSGPQAQNFLRTTRSTGKFSRITGYSAYAGRPELPEYLCRLGTTFNRGRKTNMLKIKEGLLRQVQLEYSPGRRFIALIFG